MKGTLLSLSVWLALIAWHLKRETAPELTPQQVDKLTHAFVMGVLSPKERYVPDGRKVPLIGTCFWIDKKGYILSALAASEFRDTPNPVGKEPQFEIEIMYPVQRYREYRVFDAKYVREFQTGQLIDADRETGIALLYLGQNLFYQMRSVGEGSGAVKSDANMIPKISEHMINRADQVFASCLSNGPDDHVPNIETHQGMIVECVYDTELEITRNYRCYTNIPYSDNCRGAPVVNSFGQLAGIISGRDTHGPNLVVLPLPYVRYILSRNGLDKCFPDGGGIETHP